MYVVPGRRTHALLYYFTALVCERLRSPHLRRVPRPEVGRVHEKFIGDARTFVQEPLGEIEHVCPRAVQREYARELVSEILRIELCAQRTDAHVERRPSTLVYDVDVTPRVYEQG